MWQAAFETQDRQDEEAYAAERGWTTRWTGDSTDTVFLDFTRASYMNHPLHEMTCLVNTDLSGYTDWAEYDHRKFSKQPYSFCWGEGTAFGEDEKAAWEVGGKLSLRATPWSVGDLLILDNITTMHGRLPFTADRRMAAILGDPVVRLDTNKPPSSLHWVDSLISEES